MRSRLGAFLLGTFATLAALELGLAAFGGLYARFYAPRASAADGRTTVLCVGDSFTMGTGAPPSSSYPAQLEALLNRGGPRYRVVNVGRGSANTAIARAIFMEQVGRVRPSIVTLMIGPANYWNLTGYRRPGQSRATAALSDGWRGIRVVKLFKLLRHQWAQTAQPGFRPGASSDAERVVGLLVDKRLDDARRLVDESLRRRPSEGRLHALSGLVSFIASDWDEARAAFQKALALAPGDDYARVGLMGLELRPLPAAEAARRAAPLIASLPDDALLRRVAAHLAKSEEPAAAPDVLEVMLRSGEPLADILRAGRRLLRERPRDPSVPFVMGKAELLAGRPREAEALFLRAAALAPGDARRIFGVAHAYLYSPFVPQARAWALRGRRLAPEVPDFALLMLHSYERPDLSAAERAQARLWAEEVRRHQSGGRRLLYWGELLDQPSDVVLGAAARFFDDSAAPDVDAWIREDIAAVAAECRRRGIRLVLMNYPRPTRFLGFKEAAAREGAAFVDNEAVFDVLRRQGVEAGYFVPDQHCNAAGYGLIARALADKILSLPR